MQRELARDLALDVAYVGNRGAKQLILTDFNQARPNGPDENLSIDNRRPIPGFTHIQMSFSGGNTFYHAFQAKLEKRFSRGLYVLNSFTWSKAIDNAAGHLETFNGDRSRINFLDQKSERGLSSYDIPFNNVTSIIWEIPFGNGRRYGSGMSGVANAVLGGWRTTVINSARSGNTINIYYSPSSRARVCGACYTRPNVVGPFQSPDQNPHDYFIDDNIVIPPFTAPFGNLGRNMAGHRDWHSSISAFTKTSPCRERDREWNSVRSSSTCSTEPTFERPRAGGTPAVSEGLPALSQLARPSLR